jgi:hypothetical protein
MSGWFVLPGLRTSNQLEVNVRGFVKFLFATTCWLFTVEGLGQGLRTTFTFINANPNVSLDAPAFDAEGNRLSGTDYVAMLYGGPTADSLSPAFVALTSERMPSVPFALTYNGLAGYFAYANQFVSVEVTAAGAPAWVQVRAWDTRLGATYEDVARLGPGGYGESSVFQAVGGNPYFPLTTQPQPLTGLQSFSLRPIPEPGATWLLLLGCPILLVHCRRRK